jgi:hypothetical protein
MHMPPDKFVNIMNKISDHQYDFSNWESSPEYRIFLAGRMYEVEKITNHLNCILKYELKEQL